MVRLNLSAGKELVQGSATQKEHGLQGQSFLKTETFQEKFEICEILVIYGPDGQIWTHWMSQAELNPGR